MNSSFSPEQIELRRKVKIFIEKEIAPIADELAGCGKTLFQPSIVIPAEAGIESFQCLLDSRLRGSDGSVEFFRILLDSTYDYHAHGVDGIKKSGFGE